MFINMFCSKCNKLFDLEQNSIIKIIEDRETLIVKCPNCKESKQKIGDKINKESINKQQIKIYELERNR